MERADNDPGRDSEIVRAYRACRLYCARSSPAASMPLLWVIGRHSLPLLSARRPGGRSAVALWPHLLHLAGKIRPGVGNSGV